MEVQCQLAPGMPNFNIVGLPDKAVRESKERVIAALAAMGLSFPPKRITVNLAPADLPKEGSHFDLPIALALLVPLTVALLSPGSRIVPLSWLLASVIGSGWLSLALALEARRTDRPSLAWLFALNLLITLTLNGVARASQAPEAIQWVQQIINTANQLLFLVAVRRLAAAPMGAATPDAEPAVADAAA